jgi:hypothetical protein
VARAEWILRTAACFVLAAMLFALPATQLGAGKPWYFWIGSGVIALVVGLLMLWILVRSWKEL